MMNEPTPSRVIQKIQRIFRYFLFAALVAIAIIGAHYFHIQELLRSALLWIDNLGPWEPVAFIAIYNLATVLFVPGSIVTMGGEVIFGVFWGSVYVFIAATLGATSAFLIGRYLSRDWVAKQLESHPKFKAIDEAVAEEGFKIVFLTRLSPLFPFNLLNYAFGVTQVSLKDYVLGSIGMIPGTVMYVYLGSLACDCVLLKTATQPINPQAETVKWVMRLVGFIATLAVTIYVTRIAQKALKNRVS
jgi:uncharacterized membrane protein YdjX (TVP38/TMEM64 family)